MSEAAQALANEYGGTWGNHPYYPWEDWRMEVINTDTRSSYWDWVLSKKDDQEHQDEEAFGFSDSYEIE